MFHNIGGENSRFFSELSEGVLHGPALFPDTYDLIRRICEAGTAWRQVPVVASGGIVTVQSILDILTAGAFAVQLCTALDPALENSYEYYIWLQNQLSDLMEDCGVANFDALITTFHGERDLRLSKFKKKAARLAQNYPRVRAVFDDRREQIREFVKNTIQKASNLSAENVPHPPNLRTAQDYEQPHASR